MKNKKYISFGILSVLILVVTISFVSAFGFSVPSNIVVYPGENNIQVRLNVAPSEGSMSLKVELSDSSGVAQITDASTTYSASPGYSNDGIVNIKLNVPANTPVGQKYTFSLTATNAVPPEGGMVSLASSSSITLDATVAEKPPVAETPAPTTTEEGISLIWWILGIIVVIAIIAIIWFVVKSKKE